MRIVSFDPGVPGIFAFGGAPVGIIAVGQFARGLFVIAQFGVGVVVVAQFGVGLVVLGQFACGLLQGLGMFAVGGRVRGMGALWTIPGFRSPRVPAASRPLTTVERIDRAPEAGGWVRAGLEVRGGEPRLVFDGVSRGAGERLPDGRELVVDARARAALLREHGEGARELHVELGASERREAPRAGFREAPPVTHLLTVGSIERPPRATWRSPFVHPFAKEKQAPVPLGWNAGLLRLALWLALAAAFVRYWVPEIAFAFGGDAPTVLRPSEVRRLSD